MYKHTIKYFKEQFYEFSTFFMNRTNLGTDTR